MSNRRTPNKKELAAGQPGTQITRKRNFPNVQIRKLNRRRARMYRLTKSFDPKPVKRNHESHNPRDQMIVPRSVVEEFPTKTGKAG